MLILNVLRLLPTDQRPVKNKSQVIGVRLAQVSRKVVLTELELADSQFWKKQGEIQTRSAFVRFYIII